jgi:hypothetical protein
MGILYPNGTCNNCNKKFEVGEIIYRIVKQDYCKGSGVNPKKQMNVAKLCEKCYNKLNKQGEENAKNK